MAAINIGGGAINLPSFKLTKRMENAAHPSGANIERRLLHIEIIGARNILGISKKSSGDVSDPYVQVNLVDLADRNIPGEAFKTAVKGSTTAPVWEERFAFGQKFNLDVEDDQLPSVNVNLFHKPTFSVSETPLGAVRIYLDGKKLCGGIWDFCLEWYLLFIIIKNTDTHTSVYYCFSLCVME